MAAGSSGGTDPIGSTLAPGRMNRGHRAASQRAACAGAACTTCVPAVSQKSAWHPQDIAAGGRACSPHARHSPHAAHGSGVSGGESRQGEVPGLGFAEIFLAAVCKPAVLWPAQRAESGFLQPRVVQPSNSSRRSSRPHRSRASASPAPLLLPSPAAGVPSSTGAGCPCAWPQPPPAVVINAAGVN